MSKKMTWNELARVAGGAENIITGLETGVGYKFYSQEYYNLEEIGHGEGYLGVNWWAYDYNGVIMVFNNRGNTPGAVHFKELADDLPENFLNVPIH